MEARPAVVRSEVGRSVVSESVGQEVAVVVVVGLTGKDRSHRRAAETGRNARVSCSEGRIMDGVRRKAVVEHARIFVARLPHLVSYHRGKAVLAPCIGIGQIILKLPEHISVVLYAAFVRVAGPVAEVEHRLVSLRLAPAEVETELCVPDEMLDGGDVGENAARELLTVEQNVILHSDTDRVRIGIVLVHYRSVVAVEIVYRNVRTGRERVVDETLIRVGEFKVVIRAREGDVEPELYPFLELCIEIGTHAETAEVAADDGSLLIHIGAGHIILHLFSTSGDGELVLMLICGTEDGVLPVGSDAEDGRVGIDLARIGHLPDCREVVVVLRELAQVHHVETSGLPRDCEHSVVGDLGVPGLAPLGGDQDYSVRALCSIDGSGGGVLENLHAHDVGRIDGGKRRDGGHTAVAEGIRQTEVRTGVSAALNYYAVDDIKRLSIGVDGGLTAHADG